MRPRASSWASRATRWCSPLARQPSMQPYAISRLHLAFQLFPLSRSCFPWPSRLDSALTCPTLAQPWGVRIRMAVGAGGETRATQPRQHTAPCHLPHRSGLLCGNARPARRRPRRSGARLQAPCSLRVASSRALVARCCQLPRGRPADDYWLVVRGSACVARQAQAGSWIEWSDSPARDWKEICLPRLQSFLSFQTSVLPAGALYD